MSATEMLLANAVSRLIINGKAGVINGLRKFENPSSWLVLFVAIPFNKISPFSKDFHTPIFLS